MRNIRLSKLDKTILLTALRVLRSSSTDSTEQGNISDLEERLDSLIPDTTIVTYDGEDFYSSGEKVTPYIGGDY